MKQSIINRITYSHFYDMFYTNLKNFLEKIKDILTRCPDCKGKGGYKDVILDDGSGVWYQCGFCEHGYMNVFKKVYWKIRLWYADYEDKKMKRCGK